MATASSNNNSTKVLWHRSKSSSEDAKWSFAVLFMQLSALIKYVSENIKIIDRFLLIIPAGALMELLKDPTYHFPQIPRIYVLHDNNDNLKRNQAQLQKKYKKLRFWNEEKLDKLMQKIMLDNAINSSTSIDRSTIDNVVSSWEQNISAKTPNITSHLSSESQRFTATPGQGLSVRNIEQIDSRYICPICKFLLCEPCQLGCGHRICQPCIKMENDAMKCLTCLEVSSSKTVWHDRGFRNDMQQLPISCFVCDWSGSLRVYQDHLDQKHPDVYTQQVDQRSLHKSVHTTETRLQMLSDILSSFRSIYMSNNSNAINDQDRMFYIQFQEMICTLSDGVNSLTNDQQRIDNEAHRSQTLLHKLAQSLLSLKSSFEEIVSYANALKIIQDFFAQEIWSLKSVINSLLTRSVDGTYIWKVTDVESKIADAQSERRRSIYSDPFYSSPTGYKLCLRLYLNGDNDVRDTHLSLFLVIMRGDFDAILRWPFPFKVSFRLIDQSTLNNDQRQIIDPVGPEERSNCFQRPISNMNEAYGFKRFLSIEEFEQNQKFFVIDHTMFIEAKIDFFNEMVPSSISSTGGLPNDDVHSDTTSEEFMQ